MRKATIIALALALASPGHAQQVRGPEGPGVTLATAQDIVARARATAAARGWTMAVAVVDPNGELVAFARMDGTQLASVDVAELKARSAARWRRPTRAFSDAISAGRTGLLSLPNIVASEGGVPIVVDGRVTGAVGVSGGTPEEDGQVAAAALKQPPK